MILLICSSVDWCCGWVWWLLCDCLLLGFHICLLDFVWVSLFVKLVRLGLCVSLLVV